MHGDRGPHNIPPLDDRDFGGGYLYTGQSNELWSYGEENYRIMKNITTSASACTITSNSCMTRHPKTVLR